MLRYTSEPFSRLRFYLDLVGEIFHSPRGYYLRYTSGPFYPQIYPRTTFPRSKSTTLVSPGILPSVHLRTLFRFYPYPQAEIFHSRYAGYYLPVHVRPRCYVFSLSAAKSSTLTRWLLPSGARQTTFPDCTDSTVIVRPKSTTLGALDTTFGTPWDPFTRRDSTMEIFHSCPGTLLILVLPLYKAKSSTLGTPGYYLPPEIFHSPLAGYYLPVHVRPFFRYCTDSLLYSLRRNLPLSGTALDTTFGTSGPFSIATARFYPYAAGPKSSFVRYSATTFRCDPFGRRNLPLSLRLGYYHRYLRPFSITRFYLDLVWPKIFHSPVLLDTTFGASGPLFRATVLPLYSAGQSSTLGARLATTFRCTSTLFVAGFYRYDAARNPPLSNFRWLLPSGTVRPLFDRILPL
ncbi:hypothetical protein AAG906_025890 [Vitis piasezkii]